MDTWETSTVVFSLVEVQGWTTRKWTGFTKNWRPAVTKACFSVLIHHSIWIFYYCQILQHLEVIIAKRNSKFWSTTQIGRYTYIHTSFMDLNVRFHSWRFCCKFVNDCKRCRSLVSGGSILLQFLVIFKDDRTITRREICNLVTCTVNRVVRVDWVHNLCLLFFCLWY